MLTLFFVVRPEFFVTKAALHMLPVVPHLHVSKRNHPIDSVLPPLHPVSILLPPRHRGKIPRVCGSHRTKIGRLSFFPKFHDRTRGFSLLVYNLGLLVYDRRRLPIISNLAPRFECPGLLEERTRPRQRCLLSIANFT